MKIKDLPKDSRPREKLMESGPKALSIAELLAIILRTGSKKENVLDLSNRLLAGYGIRSLSRKNIKSLSAVLGVGSAKAAQIVAVFELARRLSRYKEAEKLTISSAKDVYSLLHEDLDGLKQEHFIILHLNSRNKLLNIETLFTGTLDKSLIHPREIFKSALTESSAAIILAHNHPSGDPKPSDDDIKITKMLKEASKLIGVNLLDHIIVGNEGYFSFKEKLLM